MGGQVQPEASDYGSGSGDRGCHAIGNPDAATLSGTEERLALLLAMLLIRSVGAGVQTPAVNAVIPELAPKEELMRCNAVNASMQSLVQFAAPAAAGILLTVSTLKIILWIDILTAVLGVGILSFLPVPAEKEIPGKQSIISGSKTGSCLCLF